MHRKLQFEVSGQTFVELGLEVEAGGFGLAFEEGEKEGSRNGDDEAGLGGDESFGDAGGYGVDGCLVSGGHSGEGDEHTSDGA